MKSLLSLAILFACFVSISSCKEDDIIKSSEVAGVLSVDQWKVSYFWDSDQNETGDFAGYAFTFTVTDPDDAPTAGLVVADNGSTEVVGTWQSRNNGDVAKLVLGFSLSPFDELSEDWEVTELTSTTIKLKHVRGGNGGTDDLTLEKISL
jgi:hypothetical protein